ncbi:MAG: single-stranded DNA-binding protein [Oscillochloridaceae bacterium umkhey_bin13]
MGTRDLNKIMLTGQVEAEPEMRFTAEGEPHTIFYLTCAGSRDTTTTERLRLVAWGDPLAERCNDLLQGAKVLVEGRLQRCTADDPAEQARFPLEVRVRECLVIDPGDAAALLMPASPRPPASPTRTVNPPVAPRATMPLPPARAILPVMPARPTGPRPTIATKTGKR